MLVKYATCFSRTCVIFWVPQVGWADSLSHRLYLLNKAMAMVASDSGKKGKKGSAENRSKVNIGASSVGRDDLPRAGAMMAGLTRQSQHLAVYIGLEDAPDSGEFSIARF